MSDNRPSLQPLADYLEPRFGNIYDWDNTIVPHAADSFDIQPWTDEVRQAVKEYVQHVAPQELLDGVFPHPKDTRPEEWVDDELDSCQPWEVADLFHEAAVRALPTLDMLIGHLQTWPYEDDRLDAELWLEGHATESQLRKIAAVSEPTGLAQRSYRGDLLWDLTHAVEPPVLLEAWDEITGIASSDLTDVELELIAPFVPVGHRYADDDGRLGSARAAINGMLYMAEVGCPWSHIPIRYATWQSIYQRYLNYKRNGVFAQMLGVLQDNPDAARIAKWLRNELDRPIRTRQLSL